MSGHGPSQTEIKAVGKALKSRNVHLEDHYISIQTFLHTAGDPSEGPPDPESDGREELVNRCHLLADEIRNVRAAVGAVNFDADDKRKLRAALAATAKGWDARGEIFGALDVGRIQQAQQVADRTTIEAEGSAKALTPYFVRGT
jgi:hypothetical protein